MDTAHVAIGCNRLVDGGSTGPPPDTPPAVTCYGQPLLAFIESQLAQVNDLVKRQENRHLPVDDRIFRSRFASHSLIPNLKPSFPNALAGMEPLLEHSDPRIRCATLMMIKCGLDRPGFHIGQAPDDVRRRLRALILSSTANPQFNESNPLLGDIAADVFLAFSEKQMTKAEETQLLQKHDTQDQNCWNQVLKIFLSQDPPRFPADLAVPLSDLLNSKTAVSAKTVTILRQVKTVPPDLQVVLRSRLKRDPHSWPAKDLALLLARSGSLPAEAVPGLVQACCQAVPARGECSDTVRYLFMHRVTRTVGRSCRSAHWPARPCSGFLHQPRRPSPTFYRCSKTPTLKSAAPE